MLYFLKATELGAHCAEPQRLRSTVPFGHGRHRGGEAECCADFGTIAIYTSAASAAPPGK
jgi:hypothetical protein